MVRPRVHVVFADLIIVKRVAHTTACSFRDSPSDLLTWYVIYKVRIPVNISRFMAVIQGNPRDYDSC